MSVLSWILAGGLAMSVIALTGSVSLLMSERTLERWLLPLIAFSAGSLLGGALFHMLPAAIASMGGGPDVFLWTFIGFGAFLVLEQFLHWHHTHRLATGPEPHTYLILVGDALHNFLGGLAVGGAFLADIRVGLAAWLAAAAHEVPQEIGDFGVLVHGGWPRRTALALNFASALTFPLGGVVAYVAALRFDVAFLLPLAAGNFLYIAASDLVPEIKHHYGLGRNALNLGLFAGGAVLLYLLALTLG